MDDELIKAMGDAVISGDIDKVKDLLASNEGLINVVTPMGTWLHDAASYEQYDIAKYLIECGIDVNAIGGIEEAGAIVSAIFEGNYEIVKLLYDNGAEFDVSSHERNPLFVAIYNGHIEIVRFLVEHGIDLTASYDLGEDEEVDAYRYANMYGETEIADYLKEKMNIEANERKQEKESMDKERIKEFRRAVTSGDLDFVKEILASNEGMLHKDCWLHDAASYGQYYIAKYLIECGIDVNKKGGRRNAGAITSAAFEGDLDIVELLYSNGAEFDVSNFECNPLFAAIYDGHFDVAKFLVEKGIDLTASYDLGEDEEVDAYRYANMYGESEIADYLKEKMNMEANEGKQEKESMDKEQIKEVRQAIQRGDLDFIKDFLMSNEGALNIITVFGTWLHDAASYGQYDIAKYLIECGIDVNKRGGLEDASAIVNAAFEGNVDIVKLLLANGVELDISDDVKNPLFSAIYNGHLDVVKCLVEHGIDLTTSYEIGQYDNVDAYKYAKIYGKVKIADYLKEKMSIEETEEKQSKERDVLGRLMAVYESQKLESQLDKQTFIKLFKEGVKDIYPKLKEKYEDESIYGISFEIANTVQKVYAEDYNTIVYLNTEENFKEAIEDCEEDEMSYYRFCAWAEWSPESVPSDAFDELQDYLWENGFGFYNDMTTDKEKELSEEAKGWYEDAEDDIEDLLEEENKNIRFWLAEALGQLRKEGFWAQQENADIYVIPFEGEDEISDEELVETFQLMDQGCHGKEYLKYLEER